MERWIWLHREAPRLCRGGLIVLAPILRPLVHRLPLPLRRALGRIRALAARAIYAATGRPPAWSKYTDAHAYWNGRPMMAEELQEGGHSSALQSAGREIFLDEFVRQPIHLALDAGCGYGKELRELGRRLPHVTTIGVDFSFNQLQDAKRYAPASVGHLVQASLAALPFRDNAFDATYSTSVVSTIPGSLSGQVFDELNRVTRGRILHREVVRQHLVDGGRTRLVARFDLAAHMFSHDYATEYQRRGREVDRCEPLAPYCEQSPGPSEELWYSLVVVNPKTE